MERRRRDVAAAAGELSRCFVSQHQPSLGSHSVVTRESMLSVRPDLSRQRITCLYAGRRTQPACVDLGEAASPCALRDTYVYRLLVTIQIPAYNRFSRPKFAVDKMVKSLMRAWKEKAHATEGANLTKSATPLPESPPPQTCKLALETPDRQHKIIQSHRTLPESAMLSLERHA
jgi:hypothetical protein